MTILTTENEIYKYYKFGKYYPVIPDIFFFFLLLPNNAANSFYCGILWKNFVGKLSIKNIVVFH